MKKKYIIPEMLLVEVECGLMIAGAETMIVSGDETSDLEKGAFVKGDRGSRGSRSENYNVWKDDWSNN